MTGLPVYTCSKLLLHWAFPTLAGHPSHIVYPMHLRRYSGGDRGSAEPWNRGRPLVSTPPEGEIGVRSRDSFMYMRWIILPSIHNE